jgi:hypothetical protein
VRLPLPVVADGDTYICGTGLKKCILARKSVSDPFPTPGHYASNRVQTHPTTLAALSFPASPFADPAAAASFVSEMELVLLPSIALGGNASPRCLNSAVFKSGISGIACVPIQHHLPPTSQDVRPTSMTKSTSVSSPWPFAASPSTPRTRPRAASASSLLIRPFSTSRDNSPSSRFSAEERTVGDGSCSVNGTRACRAVT